MKNLNIPVILLLLLITISCIKKPFNPDYIDIVPVEPATKTEIGKRVYLIETAGNLIWVHNKSKNSNESKIFSNGVEIRFMTDIDLQYSPVFTGLGNDTNAFRGKINGNGHVVKNIYINRPDETSVGFVARLHTQGSIKNLGIESGIIVGKNKVGGLVGAYYNENTNIEPSISNSYNKARVTGIEDVGGLVGRTAFAKQRTLIENCYNMGDVTGEKNVGGLVGFCDNRGDIYMTNSYSGGNVIQKGSIPKDKANIGGIFGYASDKVKGNYLYFLKTDNINALLNASGNTNRVPSIGNGGKVACVTDLSDVRQFLGFFTPNPPIPPVWEMDGRPLLSVFLSKDK